jgi:hypothetical protein
MKSSISSRISIGVGVLLFFLGLFMLVDEPTAASLFASLFSDIQTLQIAGVVFQGLGAILVLTGTIRMFSSELKNRTNENQALLFGLMQRVERVEKRTVEVADKIFSLENTRAPQASVSDSLKCRFCGARIERGVSFCPNCGRSQK